VTGTPEFSGRQRRVALTWGVLCHLSFGAGVLSMIVGLGSGMRTGFGPFHGWGAVLADVLLLAQFPVAHSLLLSTRGRRWLGRMAPLGLGSALGTTTFALIASLQLLAAFLLWSPFSEWSWSPSGPLFVLSCSAYAASWLLLLKTMADAGLGVQTGYLGWGSVIRGRRPKFRGFEPRGTFRWVRQPIYVAFALTMWTGPIWTADHVLLALAWSAYCVLAPAHKERRYHKQYGERFAHYRTLVPYWIPRRRPADLTSLRHVQTAVPSSNRPAVADAAPSPTSA
jgi:protein-S-isoprenylcysteine O-methyltransferase Ste14